MYTLYRKRRYQHITLADLGVNVSLKKTQEKKNKTILYHLSKVKENL